MKKNHVTAALFICGALACGLVGLYSSISAANRARELTPVTSAGLRDTEPGRDALVEARVSERNALKIHGFVAYVHEWREIDEEGEAGSWQEDARVTPPLLLELSDGLVQVGNDDYDLEDGHAIEEGDAFEEPETRYRGIRVGDSVLAVGSARAGAELPELEADFIALGTRERYVARRRLGGLIFCGFSVLVGAVGGIVLFWDQLRRLLRRRG